MTDEPVTSSAQPQATEPEPQAGAGEQGAPEMRAEDALLFSIGMFADLAWIYLGIRAHPANGETQADFAQARLAIDAVSALVQLTEGRLDSHHVRDLHNLLSSLQLNYVQRYQPGS